MDESAYNHWIHNGRKRDNDFAGVLLAEVKSARDYTRIVALFGEPDEVRNVRGGTECFYFYKLTESTAAFDMFVYLAVVEERVVDTCTNERKNLWPVS